MSATTVLVSLAGYVATIHSAGDPAAADPVDRVPDGIHDLDQRVTAGSQLGKLHPGMEVTLASDGPYAQSRAWSRGFMLRMCKFS